MRCGDAAFLSNHFDHLLERDLPTDVSVVSCIVSVSCSGDDRSRGRHRSGNVQSHRLCRRLLFPRVNQLLDPFIRYFQLRTIGSLWPPCGNVAVVQRVTRHLGLRSVGRGFESCSRQRCVTTLGKLSFPDIIM